MEIVSGKTIGAYWSGAAGRPAGFDNLRVILSVSVILWHSLEMCYGEGSDLWFWKGPLRPVVCYIVPAFFALSGFLVAGSLLRNDLLSFASLRIIRIYPALAFEVLVSAFVIGLISTSLSTPDYLFNRHILGYMLNMIGWIHFYLPGVFDNNPAGSRVNFQLWTVPYELKCYALLTLLASIRLHRNPVIFLSTAIVLTAGFVIYCSMTNNLLGLDRGPPGLMLVSCFIFGVAFFLLKDRIIINIWYSLIALGAYTALVYNSYGIYVSSFFLAYFTIFIGIQNKRLPGVATLANYSYGIYLYGYAIQQFVSYLLPQYRIWWVNFLLSIIVTIGVAALSWHLVEKQVEKNKRGIVRRILGVRDLAVARLLAISGSKEVGPGIAD